MRRLPPPASARRALRSLWLLAGLGVLFLSFRAAPPYGGPNLYALQSDAWLAGHLDVRGPAEDLSRHDGRWYVAFPPFPSVVLLPLAAIHRTGHRALRVAGLALAVLAAWVAARVLSRLDLPAETRSWLVAALLAGTALWSSVVHSETVWYLAHVVSMLCSLLAIEEGLGRARGPLAGLWAGLAFLSRQLCVYLVPLIVVAVWVRQAGAGRRRQLLHAAAVLGVCGVCGASYLAFNAARFGNPFETGYAGMPLWGFLGERVQRYGLFHPAYLPFNVFHMFLQGPHVNFGGPRLLAPVKFDEMGTALTFASPFVIVAFAARSERPLRFAAWASVVCALGHMLLYYNNGSEQVNAQRFSLDFMPALWLLTALGVKARPESRWRSLVAWSVGWNVFALVVEPLLARLLADL